jgi:hypothetical protein
MIAKVVKENQRDWTSKIPQVMAAYRASRHEATGYSPNFLVYGRELRAPVDIVFGAPVEESEVSRAADDFVEDKLRVMREAYRLVRQQLGASQQRAKRYYDLKARPTSFKPGEWVWYYSPRRYVQRSPKWQRTYDGPYLIIRKINEVNYVLQKTRRSTAFAMHVDKLKLCADQSHISWLELAEADEQETTLVPVPGPRLERRKKPVRAVEEVNSEEEPEARPRRNAGRPRRFEDYV